MRERERTTWPSSRTTSQGCGKRNRSCGSVDASSRRSDVSRTTRTMTAALFIGLSCTRHAQSMKIQVHKYVWFIGLRLTKTSVTLINRTRPVAGPIFETKNGAIFSGELFSGEEFREKHYLSTTLFPLIGCAAVLPPWRPKCHTTAVTPTTMECSAMTIIDKGPNKR